jgi:23S rRNA-/tRNA-specific pseudouridylate synthase
MASASSRRALRRQVTAAEAGRRLDDALAAWLPEALAMPVSRSAVRRLVVAGVIRVDGRPVRRPGLPLAAGMRVEGSIDASRLGPAKSEQEAAGRVGAGRILHRDPYLLFVDKPAGLLMHATADPSRPNLYDAVKALLAEGGRDAYLGTHQRLDRDTSGVVLFTLDPSANAPLADAFAAGRVAKTYHALCGRPRGRAPSSWREEGPLGGDGPHPETAIPDHREWPEGLLVEARPATGRKHQIRIHLAGRGLPIRGDERYGGPPGPRVMLHALRLQLPHPVTGQLLAVESPYPEDFRTALVTAGRPRARS